MSDHKNNTYKAFKYYENQLNKPKTVNGMVFKLN